MEVPAGRRNINKRKRIIKAKAKAIEEGQEESQKYPYQPDGIVAQILSKLPVKSLLRFKCVSKSCRSLISDPKFALSTQSQRQQVLGISDPKSNLSREGHQLLLHRYGQIDLIDDEAALVMKVIPHTLPHSYLNFAANFKYMCAYGSCNGLVLLSLDDDLFLWNPSTRLCNKVFAQYGKKAGIPVSCDENHCQIYGLFYCDKNHCQIFGLFYDSFTDDYKVFMRYWDFQTRRFFFMVGSIRNRAWTPIPFPYDDTKLPFPFYHKTFLGTTVLNGRLHLLVALSNDDFCTPYSLVSLDPHTYEFVQLPIFPEFDQKVCQWLSLTWTRFYEYGL